MIFRIGINNIISISFTTNSYIFASYIAGVDGIMVVDDNNNNTCLDDNMFSK